MTDGICEVLAFGKVTCTFAPETLKLDATSWNMVYDNGDRVVRVNLTFLYKKDTWAVKVPNMSYYKRVDTGQGSDKLAPITERDIGGNTDHPVSQPQYIDANGEIIRPGGQIHTLTVNIVKETSFSTLLSEVTTL